MILSKKELEIVKGMAKAVDAVVETVEDAKKDLQLNHDRLDSCKHKGYMSTELYRYIYWGSDSYWDELQKMKEEDCTD
jgi:hypothetical protein